MKIYNQLLNNQNNSNSILLLGLFYYSGIGIDINKQKAVELYQRAAKLGNNIAQYNLAFMYENGKGVVKNIRKAIYWYKQSGDKDAQKRLSELESNDDSCKII